MKTTCPPVSLWVACLVCGWVLKLEFDQGNLGGSLIEKASLRSTTWIPSITPMRNKTSRKIRREAQPGTTCGMFYSCFRFMWKSLCQKGKNIFCTLLIIVGHSQLIELMDHWCWTCLPETCLLLQNCVECDDAWEDEEREAADIPDIVKDGGVHQLDHVGVQ